MSSLPRPIPSGSDYIASLGRFPQPNRAGNERRRVCVADLVMEAAKSFPEAVALSHGRDTLTYGELVAQSTRLASYLIAEFALQPGLRLEP